MSLLVAALLLLPIAALAIGVAVVVHRDGYGTLQPPRSHHGWDESVLSPGAHRTA